MDSREFLLTAKNVNKVQGGNVSSGVITHEII